VEGKTAGVDVGEDVGLDSEGVLVSQWSVLIGLDSTDKLGL
jgi:hypothetical protein